MPTKTDVFSSVGDYYLEVYTNVSSQSVAGNYSNVYWRIRVVKTGGNWYSATTNMGNRGWADSNLSGNPDLWNNTNLAYDFSSGSSWTFADGTMRVYHASDGTGSYYVNSSMTLYAIGTATVNSGTIALPRLYSTPPAPDPIDVDTETQTSMRYRFSGQGDGGSPILEWQIGYGTSSSQIQKYLTSSGTSTITGLVPATTYYFWSRGRNAAGWGPWSVRLSGRTIAGARVRVGGIWKEAIPYVRVAGKWKLAQPYVRKNGIWTKTL